jgi:SAM-dependent methyltransferase
MEEYGAAHAALYDVVFRGRGKDFAGEARQLSELVRDRRPSAASLLDVACGTGAHLETFTTLFAAVEGLEYADAMREIAESRLPGTPVHGGDMRDFDLGHAFDAVVCVGNSVACVSDKDQMIAAIGRMAAHLVPGGVLVIEPWFFPENFLDGHVGGAVVQEDDRVIARVTRSTRQGDKTRHEVKFVVADSTGISEFTDVLVVCLFTREDYEEAFERADCSVEFIPSLELAGRPNSPGLFVGVRK